MPRPLPPVYLFAALLAMYGLYRWLPGPALLPEHYALILGVPVFLTGLALAVIVVPLFRRYDTTIIPFQESNRLITSGLFRYSRNPIYLGMFTLLAGVAIILNAATPWLIVPLFILTIRYAIVRHEETALTRRFGDDYGAYCNQVNRWFGRKASRTVHKQE